MKSVRVILIDWLATILNKLMRSKLERIVRIEGGLGSQLIGLLTYEARKKEDSKTRADTSYFRNDEVSIPDTGVSIWNWKLDKYGYDLNYFSSQSKFYDKYLSLINSKSENKNRRDSKIFTQIPWKTYAKQFPISDRLEDYLEKYNLSTRDAFAVIHVRRGDYLRVASRIVSLEESINAFNKLAASFQGPLFITCDDKLSAKDLQYCKENLASLNLLIVDPITDPHIVHGLMRTASMLVTSNSTFSWTAAMLSVSKSPLLISPTTFVGEIENSTNNFFRSTSPWMVLDVN